VDVKKAEKKRWKDLSCFSKTLIIVLGTIQIGLTLATVWDVSRREQEAIRGPKKLWYWLAFIDWLGPFAYYYVGRKQRAGYSSTGC